MINLDRDPANLVTEQQVIDLLNKELGEGAVARYNSANYLYFGRRTKNIQFRPGLSLHDMLTKNKYEQVSIMRVRLIADLINIRGILGEPFEIVRARKTRTCRRTENEYQEQQHQSGDAVDIRPIKFKSKPAFKSLVKATRLGKEKGGRVIYATYIHLDSGYNRLERPNKRKKAD